MLKGKFNIGIAVVAVAVFAIINILDQGGGSTSSRDVDRTPVAPNWAAIAAWPQIDAPLVEARPDPNRRITAIVLDDSGSMGGDMAAAKQAVIDALEAMSETDRVAVVALNHGLVMPFRAVGDARSVLPGSLSGVVSEGSTPLTGAMQRARALLEDEASQVRGFGTFRMIVTTDGIADDSAALRQAVRDLAGETPIQLTTIGIGIGGSHVLRREDLGSFVDVSNVDALRGALQDAVAENTDFTAITDFTTAEEG
ncbi:MAG: vWA domain-containing protein [Pseudomonadota bacterium]